MLWIAIQRNNAETTKDITKKTLSYSQFSWMYPLRSSQGNTLINLNYYQSNQIIIHNQISINLTIKPNQIKSTFASRETHTLYISEKQVNQLNHIGVMGLM